MTRARDLGIPFTGKPGAFNAITDVKGVEVGHSTIIEGEGKLEPGKGPVRTGVTAVLPRGHSFDPVFAAIYSLNGNGEMTGSHWLTESGFMGHPMLITNTLSIGDCHRALVSWAIENHYKTAMANTTYWVLPTVAETYDGRLNDIAGFHVKQEHVFEALDGATSGPVAEGNVGGGTGMTCHQFKGGIGTSSRIVNLFDEDYTVGVLVQANYGYRKHLMIAGVPVGLEIPDLLPGPVDQQQPAEMGSIIIVIATDIPLLPHQLKRLAQRATLGLGRLNGIAGNGSGDIFIAFSTANPAAAAFDSKVTVQMMPNDVLDPVFEAVAEATEESIVNAMVAAKTMTGIDGYTVHALPHDRLVAAMKKYGRYQEPETV